MLQFGWEDFGAVLQSTTLISHDVHPTSWTGLGNINEEGTPPPPVPPLVVPQGGGVTWSTQNFSLRLIVLLCG